MRFSLQFQIIQNLTIILTKQPLLIFHQIKNHYTDISSSFGTFCFIYVRKAVILVKYLRFKHDKVYILTVNMGWRVSNLLHAIAEVFFLSKKIKLVGAMA